MTDVVSIAVCKSSAMRAERGQDTESLVRQCMQLSKENGLVLNETAIIAGAVLAAIDLSEEPDKTRLRRTWERMLKINSMLNAMTSGIPVDVEAVLAAQEMDDETNGKLEAFPLVTWWQEELRR